MAKSHKILFLDTNYFLHYPPLDQMDWLSIANSDSVLICVCMQVIHELDSKTHDPRLKDRAKRVIKELRNIREKDNIVQPGVTLELLSEDTRDELFRPGLNPRNSDDRILQCILNRKEAFPLEKVEVVSEDFGMEIKCANLSIPLLKPDHGKRLPEVEDQQLKQLRQTQQELQKHKHALPDLMLSFSSDRTDQGNSSSHFNFSLPSTTPINIEEEMSTIRRKYQSKGRADQIMPNAVLANTFVSSISKEEYERYNSELEGFFRSYEEYYKVTESLRLVAERSFSVSLTLENNGYSPAHEIDIHIHFPQGMNIVVTENMPSGLKDRKPPNPPREPRSGFNSLFDLGHIGSQFLDQPLLSMPSITWEERNVSGPKITGGPGFDVHFEVEKLKHSYSVELGELFVLFPSKQEAGSFAVEYRLTADNRPDSQSGKLHFILTN